jgi:hypothetical protein
MMGGPEPKQEAEAGGEWPLQHPPRLLWEIINLIDCEEFCIDDIFYETEYVKDLLEIYYGKSI